MNPSQHKQFLTLTDLIITQGSKLLVSYRLLCCMTA